MGKINAEWHKSNRMPAKATLDQRVTWHLEHKNHCGCRSELPRSIQQELDRRAKAKKVIRRTRRAVGLPGAPASTQRRRQQRLTLG